MNKKNILPFDMSLRFWSDGVPFGEICDRLGLPLKLLDTKGRPMSGKAPIAGRLAKRHFASVAQMKGTTFAEVVDWLHRTIGTVQADDALVRLLETRQAEALFWIAMFGRDPAPTPALDADLVALLARCHARAMIENYTSLVDGNPSKTWFPA